MPLKLCQSAVDEPRPSSSHFTCGSLILRHSGLRSCLGRQGTHPALRCFLQNCKQCLWILRVTAKLPPRQSLNSLSFIAAPRSPPPPPGPPALCGLLGLARLGRAPTRSETPACARRLELTKRLSTQPSSALCEFARSNGRHCELLDSLRPASLQLAYRCSADILILYLEGNPSAIDLSTCNHRPPQGDPDCTPDMGHPAPSACFRDYGSVGQGGRKDPAHHRNHCCRP